MNFSKTYRRMNEPVGPSPELIRKTLSPTATASFGWRRPLPGSYWPWRSGRRRICGL